MFTESITDIDNKKYIYMYMLFETQGQIFNPRDARKGFQEEVTSMPTLAVF